jgi:hypothetical protein
MAGNSPAFQRRDCRERGISPECGCPQPQHVRKWLDVGTLGEPWLAGAAAAGDSRAPDSPLLKRRVIVVSLFVTETDPIAGTPVPVLIRYKDQLIKRRK